MNKLAIALLLVAVLGKNQEVLGVKIGNMDGEEPLYPNSENTEQSEIELAEIADELQIVYHKRLAAIQSRKASIKNGEDGKMNAETLQRLQEDEAATSFRISQIAYVEVKPIGREFNRQPVLTNMKSAQAMSA